jgi:hypothetical protein
LWCTEFGALSAIPTAMRERWYRDILVAFARLGIAWTNWEYRGDEFGIFGDNVRPAPVHRVLTKSAEPVGTVFEGTK